MMIELREKIEDLLHFQEVQKATGDIKGPLSIFNTMTTGKDALSKLLIITTIHKTSFSSCVPVAESLIF